MLFRSVSQSRYLFADRVACSSIPTKLSRLGTVDEWQTDLIYVPIYAFMDVTGYLYVWWSGGVTGNVFYVKNVSFRQLVSPSTTGVTITSTADGSTFNWATKEEGFNYNDASGYTYQLERERSLLVQEFIRGFISSWELSSDNNVRISVKNEAMLWAKKTLRIHSSSCPWVFKGTECGYSGTATWCDKNYARCGELLNTDNYGGFRFLPSIMEKEIWWGKSRK